MNTFVHEETYRGADLLAAMASKHIVVCGCGAIGSNLVDNMVRQGFRSFTAIDMDRVEDHNRHTQIWGRRDVGQLKTVMLKNHVYANMGVAITDYPKKLDGGNIEQLIGKESLVVDAFDNSESRGLVTKYCRDFSVDCLHVGLYEGYAESIWNEEYRVPRDTQGQDVCEYPLARNIILLSVVTATECVIRYLRDGEKQSFTMTLGDLRITKK